MTQLTEYKLKLNHANAREVTHDGRKHLVVPVIMMVEGVHAGNNGPLLYTPDEFGQNVQAWNGVPVPIIHPHVNGQNVSANDPAMVEQFNAGRLYNAFMGSDNKLRAEAWIDIEKAEQLHPGIINELKSDCCQMDVSTGMFTNDENTPGTWNNQDYVGVVRDIIPDHLALLPGMEGACNWQDGCGVRVNKKQTGGDKNMSKKILLNAGDAQETVEEITPHLDNPAKVGWVKRRLASLARYFGEDLTVNLMSDEEVQSSLQKYVDSLDRTEPAPSIYHYVVATYGEEKYFVYKAQTENGECNYFKQNFETIDNKIQPVGTPEEVMEQRDFVPINGPMATNQKVKKEQVSMEKKEKVAALIANEKSPYEEKDTDFLTGLEDEQLDALIAVNERVKEPVEPVVESEPEPVSLETFVSNAPEEVKGFIQEGLAMRDAKKKGLIDTLTANEKCPFTADQLGAKDIPELDGLVALAGSNQPADYSGQAGVAVNTLTSNDRKEDGTGVPAVPNLIDIMNAKK